MKKNLKRLFLLFLLVSIISGIIFFILVDIPFGTLFYFSFYFFAVSILSTLFLLILICVKSSKIVLKLSTIFPALFFLVFLSVMVVFSVLLISEELITEPTKNEWREDLNYLVSQMENKHPGFKHETSREEFHEISSKIEANIDSMSSNEITMEFYRLCAFFKDAHTFPIFPGINAHNFPLRIFKFEEGWYIIDAGRKYRNLIGEKILKIGSADIEEIFEVHADYITGENHSGKLNRFTYVGLMPEWIQTQGYIQETKRGIFTLESQNGKQYTKIISSVKGLFYTYWGIFRKVDNSLPWVFENYRKEGYKIEMIEKSKTLYIQCNTMSTEITEFSNQITDFTENIKFDRCIIDLRNNTGGNDKYDEKFISAIKNNPSINRRGKLFVISSGLKFIIASKAGSFPLR